MKNLFGLDLLTEEYLGKEFIVRKTDCKLTEYQEKLILQTEKIENRKRFPFWLTVLEYICAFAAILMIFIIVMDIDEYGVSKIFAVSLWKFAVALSAAAAWLAIFIASQIYGRTAEKAPAFRDVYKVIEEEVYDKSYEKLSIPASAEVIDIISDSENAENSKKLKKRSLCFTVEVRIFTENGNLCLSDLESVMAIPLNEIAGVESSYKTVRVGNWTKKEEYNAERFKKYGIRKSRAGEYFIRGSYSVRVNHAGEEWEFSVPCYDGETLKKYIDFEL